MWLHVQNNERKFFAGIAALFEAVAPGENTYVVSERAGGPVPDGATLIEDADAFESLLASRDDWDGIIFNPLAPHCWPWLKHVPAPIPVVWYRWGYEAYETSPYLKRHCGYMPETQRFVYSLKKTYAARESLKGLRDFAIGRFKPLRRVDVFVGPEEEEYDLYRKAGLLSDRAIWKFGAITAVEDICRGSNFDTLGVDIKVGNSSNPANNHVEAFRWLSKFDLTGRKVIVPLSYGSDLFLDTVLKKGEEILGAQFEPIVDFLPLEEYNRKVNRCGFVVMNHLRQQGGGNITADLWRGSNVYMNDTTYYKTRTAWGLSVGLISTAREAEFFTPKAPAQIGRDRTILQKKLGRSAVYERTREILGYCRQLGRSGGGR